MKFKLFTFLFKYFPNFAKSICPHSWGGYQTQNLLLCWRCGKILTRSYPPCFSFKEYREVSEYGKKMGWL